MQLSANFSPDYFAARDRFRAAVQAAGGSNESYTILARGPRDEELTIDTACLGVQDPQRTVIVSSGLHGVEGFFGSAVQSAWLSQRVDRELPVDTSVLFLHALNPFGFAWRRRWNEENVDLNRNFLLTGENYSGCPPLYSKLNALLNPPSPPSRWEPFALRAGLAVLRYGSNQLAQAVPVGQYDFPRGMFFGGHEPAETYRLLESHLADWIGSASAVLHIDLHTGLGPFGAYQLLVDAPPGDARVGRLIGRFGEAAVSANRLSEGAGKSGVLYASRGTWEYWCLAKFADRTYDFATAEFGTYSGPRVIAALRAENRAYHYADPHDPKYEWTRRQSVEAFAPRSEAWRNSVIKQGIEIIDRAVFGSEPQH